MIDSIVQIANWGITADKSRLSLSKKTFREEEDNNKDSTNLIKNIINKKAVITSWLNIEIANTKQGNIKQANNHIEANNKAAEGQAAWGNQIGNKGIWWGDRDWR